MAAPHAQESAAAVMMEGSGGIERRKTRLVSGIISSSLLFDTPLAAQTRHHGDTFAVRSNARRQHLKVSAAAGRKSCGRKRPRSVCWWRFCSRKELRGPRRSRTEA